MTNTPSSLGSQEQQHPEPQKDPAMIEAAIGQTIDLSDVTMSPEPNEDAEKSVEMQTIPYALTVRPEHRNGIQKKKVKYENIIMQAGTRALEQERQQCGLVIFNALLSEEGVARYNDCLQTLQAIYAGQRCPIILFTEYFKHLAQYCDMLATGPNGEVAENPLNLRTLSAPTRAPTAQPVEGRQLTIREQVLAKLKAKQMAKEEEDAQARLAQANEQQKAPIGIDLTDDNKDAILRRALESTRRTNASGGFGTLEDRITTHIGTYLLQNNEAFRDDVYADTKESVERYLSPGETWDDETFYKIWNEIAALADTQD
ncbi:hypothetical protein K8942_05350 [Candidatus Peribacteria bacterium]|nr:MAG: hypothetical protein K8942_05350 [Candidatus Peribacteria bacterium]